MKYAMTKTENDARGNWKKKKETASIMAREKKSCAQRVTLDVWTVNGRGALWRPSSVSLSLLIVTFLLFKFTTIIIIIILIPFTHHFLSAPLNYFVVLFLRPFFPVPWLQFSHLFWLHCSGWTHITCLHHECVCFCLHLAMYNLSQLLHTPGHR